MSEFVQFASSNVASSYLCSRKLEVTLSPLHVDGVVAKELVNVGDVIYTEKPLCFLQAIPNAQDVIVCGGCQTVLGSLDVHVGILSKTVSREDITSHEGIIPCRAKCGVLYCSDACHQNHWCRGHKMLCTGSITDEEADSSALLQFKIHACETNEIFLLVADVFASICCSLDEMRAEGSMDDAMMLTRALNPYANFVRNPWWEVAIPSVQDQIDNSEESPEKFAQTLQQLVTESWNMLRQTLDLDGRGLAEILSIDYMARTIGMFEQNNIGVRCEHPLVSTIASLRAHDAVVNPILLAVKAISKFLEEQEDDDEEWEDASEIDEEMDESEDAHTVECSAECSHDYHEHMDVTDTGDASLTKLHGLLREYDVENIFPPLDGTALFSMLCKINHSCEPNVRVKYVFTKELGLTAFLVALKEIHVGSELLQSYIDQTMGTDARQAALADYGFRCSCPKCTE